MVGACERKGRKKCSGEKLGTRAVAPRDERAVTPHEHSQSVEGQLVNQLIVLALDASVLSQRLYAHIILADCFFHPSTPNVTIFGGN